MPLVCLEFDDVMGTNSPDDNKGDKRNPPEGGWKGRCGYGPGSRKRGEGCIRSTNVNAQGQLMPLQYTNGSFIDSAKDSLCGENLVCLKHGLPTSWNITDVEVKRTKDDTKNQENWAGSQGACWPDTPDNKRKARTWGFIKDNPGDLKKGRRCQFDPDILIYGPDGKFEGMFSHFLCSLSLIHTHSLSLFHRSSC